MRGNPVSRELKNCDGVLLAAHWEGEDLFLLRMAERRGVVWGDAAPMTPEAVMERIRSGACIYVASSLDLPGDFHLEARVDVEDDHLVVAGRPLTKALEALPVY